MQQPEHALPPGAAPLPSLAGPGTGQPPQHPKSEDKREETNRNGGEPPGLEEEGRGSPKGNGGVTIWMRQALEDVNGAGGPQEEMRAWRETQEEGERAVMQRGTNLCCFIRVSVNQLVC